MAGQLQGRQRRTNDPDGIRRRLIDAAFAAFSTRGYHSTSIHDLKQDTGATGGTLAHHFATKKDLGLAVVRDRVAGAVEETWIRPVLSSPTAADGIKAVFDSVADELESQGSVSGCPLNNLAVELARYDEDFRASIDGVFVKWRDAIASKVREDLASGRLARLDPEAFATLVVASYSGAMAMAKSGQSARPLRLCAEQLLGIMRQNAPRISRRHR